MNTTTLSKMYIFKNITKEDIDKMSNCMGFKYIDFKKEEYIFRSGDKINKIGIILSGSIRIEGTDFFGNTNILSIRKSGDIIGEMYASNQKEPVLVNFISNEYTKLIFIPFNNIINPCKTACSCHVQIIQNLLTISGKKNLELTRRMYDISPKTIRERLISYFSREVSIQGSNNIVIPFDRQQLADYLSLDRSALSKELGKMKRDNIIEFYKNKFTIKIKI